MRIGVNLINGIDYRALKTGPQFLRNFVSTYFYVLIKFTNQICLCVQCSAVLVLVMLLGLLSWDGRSRPVDLKYFNNVI